MKKKINILLFTLLAPALLVAQTIITGKVLDSRDKQQLTGANVYVVNAENRSLGGCIVDLNGGYRLQIPDQKNLRITFSFIGYTSKVVDYTGQRTIDVLLEESGQQLSALEVTASRVERNAQGLSTREMVGAVQKVTLENLETSMVTNITEALQGAMANVDILTGADPGSGTYIRIRGTSSLSASSEPLFVVDGVPLPVDVSSDFNFATANSDDYSQLLNIPPSDIESIEVLKDAAATAVWGSKGANGVWLITTKKGTKGRLTFSFNSKNELKRERNSIPMLNANQYVSMMQDAIWNTVNDIGQGDDLANTYLSLLYNTKEIGFDPAWVNFDEYNQDINWLDLITQPGFSFDNNFSVSGGGDKTDYRVSLGLLNEEGTTVGTAFQRFSTSLNMRYKFSDRL
ncbi:MAG: TonB-dependent receptor plug domain-containing protein, partial [Bacteroidales bacterium]|nr:TonB-dependent receptor plug domain-containing protein [Bacteroidales bacterium]